MKNKVEIYSDDTYVYLKLHIQSKPEDEPLTLPIGIKPDDAAAIGNLLIYHAYKLGYNQLDSFDPESEEDHDFGNN